MAEKSALEILEEAKQKFYAPPMAPLNWQKPATVRVGAFNLTEKEIDAMIAEFETTAPKDVKSGKNKGLEITFLTNVVNKVLGRNGSDNTAIRDYAAARERLKYLQGVVSKISSDGTLFYFVKDGERTTNYTPEAYAKLISDAEAAVKALEPKAKPALEGFGPTAKTYPNTPEGKLQQERDLIVQALAKQNERLDNPITSVLNRNDVIKQINKLNQDLINIDKKISPAGKTATATTATAATSTATTATTATAATGVAVKVYTPEEVKAMLTPQDTGLVVGKKAVVFTKADVDAKLVELNLTDTPENRKTARQALKAATPVGKPAVADNAWEAIFKQNYPQYNWMFTDLDRRKYADVFDLFSMSFDKTGKQIIEDAEFKRRFDGTSWYTELESSKKGRELSAAIGTFSWGSGNLAKFLTKAIQYGYTGENLKQQAYTDLFSKVGDKYANENAVGEVRASSPYLALKRIGTQYLQPFADDTIEKALSGGETADDLLRKARVIAAEQYPHLKNAINAGVTLEELAANYKKIASETLELDPSQIDMNGIYNVALKTGEGGKERMMSYSEWQTMLRTDPKYKYSFTKQANQDATDIGLSIARAFGKVG